MPTFRNLSHTTDPVSSATRRATGSVQSLGTSAKVAAGLGDSEWMADLEYVWRVRTSAELHRLHRRARHQRRAQRRAGAMSSAAYDIGDTDIGEECAQERVRLARSAEWAEHRAQAMALPRGELLAVCGTRQRTVACACGRQTVPVGCDQTMLCVRCSRRQWRKWRRRITRAMDSHVRAARAEWGAARRRGEARGQLPGVYLVTLTVPHTGSVEADRKTLATGWRRLTKIANAHSWWGAYALTYEVTPGTTGEGHVHLHLAAVSSWIPYEELHAAWRSLTGARVLDVSAPRSGRVQNAADYLAKYVTKGVNAADFTGQKAGEVLVAWRGKRKVTTSKAFWTPSRDRERRCPRCGNVHRSVEAPHSLRAVAPGAVLQAMAERVGWWVPRGGIQTALNLERRETS